ncbi:uncharacterized protein ChrSV_p0040 (plasmid) [Chromobacterium vaccinii]|nr:uncharacterized protein ChrSW_p0040 [Chromobacterium vaccinii]QND87458.1 uncharacterized protein ChrSV_p0040 [Chromobacterium vaccinii]
MKPFKACLPVKIRGNSIQIETMACPHIQNDEQGCHPDRKRMSGRFF